MKHIKITICFLVVLIAGSAPATDRNVPQEYPTIQAAVDACNDFDTVIVAPGTYSGSGNRDINFNGKLITVRSIDPGDLQVVNSTVIDCEVKGRGFAFNTGENADSKVMGLTITNGSGMVGGAIYCYNNSSPSITNCVIRNNSALFGGGIACTNGKSYPVIANCQIIANSALFGGGGGVYLNGSSPTIKNCIISGNIAPDGGAIYSHNAGEPVITNCTICANTASASAGGIYCYKSSNMTISNTILWTNAAVSAAEIFVGNSGAATSVRLSYCDIQDPDNNIICGSGCIVSWGPGNIDADPQFADSDNSDYHLLQDSPCIDAGNPDFAPAPGETDIDGSPRIAGTRIDIGADEFQPPILAEIKITPKMLNPASNGNWINCSIWLGNEYDISNVNIATITLNGETIEPELCKTDEQAQKLHFKFDRSEIQNQNMLESAESSVSFSVAGKLNDGQDFGGNDTIRIVRTGGKK